MQKKWAMTAPSYTFDCSVCVVLLQRLCVRISPFNSSTHTCSQQPTNHRPLSLSLSFPLLWVYSRNVKISHLMYQQIVVAFPLPFQCCSQYSRLIVAENWDLKSEKNASCKCELSRDFFLKCIYFHFFVQLCLNWIFML